MSTVDGARFSRKTTMRKVASTVPGLLALLFWLLPAQAGPAETESRAEVDRVAWQTFVDINVPSDSSSSSSPAGWETWAHNAHTFPEDPDPWQPPQHEDRFLFPGFDKVSKGRSIEITRNATAFHYVIRRCLWFQEGLIRAFAADPVEFPPGAIEIEAGWKPIPPDQRDSYHWKKVGDRLYGLVGLDLRKKMDPDLGGDTGWLFATWEHKDSYGRCAEIGCEDRFGAEPSEIRPQFEVPEDRLTPELLEMFERAGLPAIWQSYRLKGTQIVFEDARGEPTLLGNSVLEIPYTAAPSCISCHARAAIDAHAESLGSDLRSIGKPNPYWFEDPDGTVRYRALDHSWSPVLHAKPATRSIDAIPPPMALKCDGR